VPPPQVGLTLTLSCPDEAPAPHPVVQSLSIREGPPAGGTAVVIMGSGFTPASTVTFGSRPAASTTYVSPQMLAVVSPAGGGAADVVVHTAGGASTTSSVDQFLFGSPPTITAMSVHNGSVAGGTTVTVSGSGFTGATVVAFGAASGRDLQVKSDTKLVVRSPAQSAGTVDVEVQTAAGANGAGSADRFTFVAGKPTASRASLSGVAKRRARLSFTLAAGLQAPALKSLILGLPRGLTLSGLRKHLSMAITVTSAGAKQLRFSVKLARGALTITPSRAAAELKLTISYPAVEVSAKLARMVKHDKVKTLAFVLTTTDTGHRTTKLALKVHV